MVAGVALASIRATLHSLCTTLPTRLALVFLHPSSTTSSASVFCLLPASCRTRNCLCTLPWAGGGRYLSCCRRTRLRLRETRTGCVSREECGRKNAGEMNSAQGGGCMHTYARARTHVHLRTCTRTHTCAHARARTHTRTHVPAFVSGVISGSPGPPAMMVVMYRGFVYVLFAIRPAL